MSLRVAVLLVSLIATTGCKPQDLMKGTASAPASTAPDGPAPPNTPNAKAAQSSARPAARDPKVEATDATENGGTTRETSETGETSARPSVESPGSGATGSPPPKWVPKSDRVSVVSAPDLAENLGAVPKGTTAKSTEPVSVRDIVERQETERARNAPADPQSPWLKQNGRVRVVRR